MHLPDISNEQQKIIDEIENNNNVCIEANAGCGKTSSILWVAKSFPNKRILQITYNSELKLEVRKKSEKLGLDNIEIHSYHSLAVKYYNKKSYTDDIMTSVIKNDDPPIEEISVYNIIVIDEAQDMTLLFKQLVSKFINDMPNKDFLIVVLGDVKQAINKFRNADPRYLSLCESIWNRDFVVINLTTSYRLTNQMGLFINEVMLGKEVIQTVKDFEPVTYINCNPYKYAKELAHWIINTINDKIYKPDDFFLLGYSLKKKRPIKIVENILTKYNIPCFYSTSEEKQVDADILKNKVVFSTFHSSKGRQRKVCIVFDFDATYFKFYDRTSSQDICPELLYVATSRAEDILILIKDSKQQQLQFLKKSEDEIKCLDYVNYINPGEYHYPRSDEEDNQDRDKKTTPTSLVAFLKGKYLYRLTEIRNLLFSKTITDEINITIQSKIEFENTTEDVSDINGLIIPSIFEYRNKGDFAIAKSIKFHYEQIKGKDHQFLEEAYSKIDNITNFSDIVYMVICYLCFNDRLYNRLKLITHYDWIEEEDIEKTCNVLNRYLDDKNTIYEKEIQYAHPSAEYGTISINGRVDCISNNNVFELKCTRHLTLEHFLQLIVYCWLIKKSDPENYDLQNFKILNIMTNELYILNKNEELIDEVMEILLENKYKHIHDLSDEEFLKLATESL